MNYIVFDLEWNQADNLKAKRESGLTFEIIELGAVKLTSDMAQIGSFHELIRPQVFERMNYVTGELIHLSMGELRNCRTFKEVAGDFLNWCGDDYIFCTWGDSDLHELQANMDFYGMSHLSDNSIRYYDVQKLFGIAYEGKRKQMALKTAVELLGIEEKARFHRADTDAFYTAEVLRRLDRSVLVNYSFDTYRLPADKAHEINVMFDDYAKHISREFPDKTAALGDEDVVSSKCFLCGARMRKKVPCFSKNGRNYYMVMVCPKHGYIKSKIRLKKSVNNKVYVVKTVKQTDQETVDALLRKRDQAVSMKGISE